MDRNDSARVAGDVFLMLRSWPPWRKGPLRGPGRAARSHYRSALIDRRRSRLLQRPPNRRLADLVLARQFRHGLAGSVPLGNAPALAGIECGRPAELLAVGLGPLDAFLATLPDQAALKLGDTAHDG